MSSIGRATTSYVVVKINEFPTAPSVASTRVRHLIQLFAIVLGAASLAAWEAYERLGSPEGELALAQAVVYLGTAPKSNALYTAIGASSDAS